MAHQRIVLNQIDVFFLSLSIVYSFFSLLLLDVCERVCCARGGNLCCYVLYYKREKERLPFVVLEREGGGGGCLCARGSAYCGWIGSLRLSGRLAPLWPARGEGGGEETGKGMGGFE